MFFKFLAKELTLDKEESWKKIKYALVFERL